jgi:hypothetical protein
MQRLMRRFMDPRRARFSALFMGINSGILMIPLGLSLCAALPTIGFVPPIWAWLVSLVGLPLAGTILHFNTQRLVYIKSFFVATTTLWSCVYGGVAWYLLTWNMETSFRALTGLGIATVLLVAGLQTYLSSFRSPERATMPHEVIGALDETTGIVDPTSSPTSAKKRAKQMAGSTALLWRLAPVTAALSMLLVRALPATGDLILGVVVAIGFATIGAVGAGGNMSYVIASRRWEQKHGKPICVMRNVAPR